MPWSQPLGIEKRDYAVVGAAGEHLAPKGICFQHSASHTLAVVDGQS